MKRIRVLIAEDQDIYASGIRTVLMGCADIEVLPEYANTGPRLVDLLAQHDPDVLALDAYMPGFALVPFVAGLQQQQRQKPRVILVTSGTDAATLLAVRSGVRGVLLKGDPLVELLPDAIRYVMQGHDYTSPRAAELIEAALRSPSHLTPAQTKIVSLMATGQSPDEIALALGVSVSSIYSHQDRIRHRLGLDSNLAVVAWHLKNTESQP